MISKRTVLVLGAGSSVPFGFPTGAGLRERICDELRSEQHENFGRIRACAFGESTLSEFASEFLYSGVTSIDAFIATRPEFGNLGLFAIASTLLPMEHTPSLYMTGSQPIRYGQSDWYQALWDSMRTGTSSAGDVLNNKLSVITFNYDRSLEMFLLNAIRHTYGISETEAFSLFSKFDFHHVYGSLGSLEPGTSVPYGAVPTPTALRLAAKELKVMPSSRPSVDPKCVELFTQAQSIVFMGFGYDEMNCMRLGIRDILTEKAGKPGVPYVAGSCLGMTSAQRAQAISRIAPPNLKDHVDLVGVTCAGFLAHTAGLVW